MLVLTRRIGESVIIAGDIEVTVLDIKGDNVRVGVKAPRETRIQRAEIVNAVGAENVAATAAGASDEAMISALSRRTTPPA